MKRRMLKVIAMLVTVMFTSSFICTNIALAYGWGYNSWYDRYPPYSGYYGHRHGYWRNSHWSSKDTWWLVGLAALGIGIWQYNESHKDKSYSSEKVKNINKFNSEELHVYQLISSLPAGQIQSLDYTEDYEHDLIVKVIKKLWGDCVYVDSYYTATRKSVFLYRFTQVYESKKVNGEYADFVARDLLNHMGYGTFKLKYDSKLEKSLAKMLALYRPGSYCQHSGDYLIVHVVSSYAY